MKKFEAKDLRTITLVGHGKSGKTSLAEAFLFDTKATTRMGKVDDESSNLDTEPEELKRKASIQCAVGYVEYKKVKVNFIDTPGDGNFMAEAELGASAADAAVIVVSAPDGVQIGTERGWDIAIKNDLPRAVFINKLDRERASFEQALKDVQEVLCKEAVAMQIPIGGEGGFAGVVDLLTLQACTFDDEGRAMKAGALPADLQAAAGAAREKLIEGIAATDDALMEKYLETLELSEQDVQQGLSKAILAGKIVPVLCGSATRNIGIQPLLDLIVTNFPSPLDRPPARGKSGDQDVERSPDPAGPFSARVFKTVAADVGRMALVRIVSGTLAADSNLVNTTRGTRERIGQFYALIGKKRETISEAVAGDIVGLAKLKDTRTGDTLCDEKSSIVYPMVALPEPVISFSVRAKSKGDEEKVASKLNDILHEDISLRLDRDQSSKEMLLRGMGQIHIETAVEKLRRFGVDVELAAPKVPYRETIKGKSMDVEGKHKKQSGGRGQFGVCYIDMEPKPKDSEVKDDALEFVDAIFGGAIPRQFIPAIEKGIRDRMSRGVVAGYPIVNIKVTLKDGKYHDVDSDGRSFEMAGSKGFQEAFKKSNPVLLEPVMNLEVTCPNEYMGDIIGDISSRRGKVAGTDTKGRNLVVKAAVPLAELLRYAIDLESITAGRGSYSMSFASYEEVPSNLADKIIANAKLTEDEE